MRVTKPWNSINVPDELYSPKGMIGPEERRALYWLGQSYYSGQGVIVDAGAFLGSSAFCLAAGAARNTTGTINRPCIFSFDYFKAVDDYVAKQISSDFRPTSRGDDYLDIFLGQTWKYSEFICAQQGDFLQSKWVSGPIEILFIDVAKTQDLNSHLIREFFPHLIPGRSIVVHQDFYHCWHPYIHITMEALAPYFDIIDSHVEYQSRLYLCKTAIPNTELELVAKYAYTAEERIALLDRLSARESRDMRAMAEVVKLRQLVLDNNDAAVKHLNATIKRKYGGVGRGKLWWQQAEEVMVLHETKTNPAFAHQRLLAEYVLDTITAVPSAPAAGQYLTEDQAENIVDETIHYVAEHCDAVEYKYLLGHRRRLTISLTFIPKAETDDASFLDVGCYGYMAFWAWKHLGYRRVEGIELLTEAGSESLVRQIKVKGDQLNLRVHNFDIAAAEWPLQETFSTVLFLETLEHVNSDPMGAMLNVVGRMRSDSTLVVSVPNAVSYQALQEYLTGMPPWTYWFFHPDLRHEPRHAFEYTPFVLKVLLRASGLEEIAFRTICAYSDRKDLNEIFEIGKALSIDARLFGETMIVQARKNSDLTIIRYPDCIYSSERYYQSTFPVLESKRRDAIRTFRDAHREREPNLVALEAKLSAAEARLRELQGSTSWRISGPIRRVLEPFPRLRFRIRAALTLLRRVGQVIARRA